MHIYELPFSSNQAYGLVASEYYDAKKHPTCANFRTASEAISVPWIEPHCLPEARIWEVGAGRSILLEYLIKRNLNLSKITISDVSSSMLEHSKRLGYHAAQFVVTSAHNLPATTGELNLVISSLGDPYNFDGFWREVFRVLKPGGYAIFTTPSYEWAKLFRNNAQFSAAEFMLADGSKIYVPSLIPNAEEQIKMIEGIGLEIISRRGIGLNELGASQISYKIRLPGLLNDAFVNGYLVRKPVLND